MAEESLTVKNQTYNYNNYGNITLLEFFLINDQIKDESEAT